ncbi:MAG: phosphoribosylanthranilate isomerase [Sphingobacteriaceae bacterium]|nr:phosphoribosylanthranilate isomerase [Cytophagaceae bacterium]
MRIKVCGMREPENLRQLLELQPDYVGFIFHEASPRFVGDTLDPEVLKEVPRGVKKVGVFVNASIDQIVKTVRRYGLDYAQLHGEESPDFCRNLQFKGVNIIKAFPIDDAFNFTKLNNFKPHCDFFLFDAKGVQRGGNGEVFDWALLNRYDNEKPFFLAGGISLDNVEELTALAGLRLHAIDINSKFETAPGLKDIEKIRLLMEKVKPVEEEV